MKKKFFLKLVFAVFASSFLIMACQPTKNDRSDRRQMRNGQTQDVGQPRQDMNRMPMKKQYDDGGCCPQDCCPKSDCEWCKPRCEDTDGPQGIYAPREPMKKKCPDCPPDDCCDPCGDCCDPCDDCCDDCCDPCDDCCDDCCDPCDDCCDSCDDCCDPCDSCCPSGRKYTRDEIFGRDTEKRQENRNDPRRYSER